MEGPPTESQGSEWTPPFLNSCSERSLGAAGSRPSPRLGQRFVSTGLHMKVSWASVQHAIKVIRAKSTLPYYRVRHDTGRLPKLSRWWKISLPRGVYPEGCHSPRGDHHHAATLHSRENFSKRAHLGCHIYGKQWLAGSHTTRDGKGMHETLCTHNFVPQWISLGEATGYSWVNRMMGVPSWYALMLTVSLCSVVGFHRTGWN